MIHLIMKGPMALHMEAELNVIELAMARCSGPGMASSTIVSRILGSAADVDNLDYAFLRKW